MKLKSIVVSILALVMSVVPLAIPSVASAAGCNVYTASSTHTDALGDYLTGVQTVPSNSTCHDIQIKNYHTTNSGYSCGYGKVSVEFYPSSGGSTVGKTYTVPCFSSSYTVLATNVADGTKFAILGWYTSNPNVAFTATIED